MEVYAPILGLEKLGLEPIQLLEMRNLDAPGASTNLLIQIDTLYAIRKKTDVKGRKELKAVFKFPQLNNPEIFQGQLNLNSIGLALLVKSYEATKKARYVSQFDVVCATGVIAKYPTEADVFQGNFIDDAAGDIEEKLNLFIDFIKARQLRNKKIAFIYNAKIDEDILRKRLITAGLDCIEVKKADNFNQLQGYLFKARSAKPMYFILPMAACAAGVAVFFIFKTLFPFPQPGTRSEMGTDVSLLKPDTLIPTENLETVNRENKTQLMLAVEKEDLTAARLLIVAGARVNAPFYRGDKRKMVFLRRACEGTMSSFPVSGRLEDNSPFWGVYWEEALPSFSKIKIDFGGKEAASALKLSLLKGEPYAFAHFYLNLEPRSRAVNFNVNVRLYLAHETTSNNINSNSIVQALELSVNKYDTKRRYELAWQWENAGEGAPQWRFWDAARGWVGAGISQRLASRMWHQLSFAGKVSHNDVYYDSLSIDGITYVVGKTASTVTLHDPYEYLAVAVQLDGNSRADPYDVYIRDLVFKTDD
jgi:hypothetical protein